MKNAVASTLVVILLVAAAAGGYLVGETGQRVTTVVSTSTALSTITTTATTIATTTVTTTSTTTTTNTTLNRLIASCVGEYAPDGMIFGIIPVDPSTQLAIMCVQFYYYNSTAPITVNATNEMFIGYHVGSSLVAAPNITIIAKPALLTIGGPSNESEGAMVVYYISPSANLNGTYILDLGNVQSSPLPLIVPTNLPTDATGGAPPGTMLESCGIEFFLVAGSGIPNYAPGAGCFGQEVVQGLLFAKVVGINFCTQNRTPYVSQC